MSRLSGDLNARSRKPYDRPSPRASDGMWVHDKAPPVGKRASVTANGGARAGLPNTKLVVSDLHYNVTAKDLIAIFGQIGTLVREPVIKYDRSGRSTGVAFVHYETAAEATRARNQFNGILAKGQPMVVAFDTFRPARRAVSAPNTLIDRISKPPLLERLASDAPIPVAPRKSIQTNPPKGQPEAPKGQSSGGPIRTRRRRGGRGGEKVKKEPKTVEDLDNELDAFMGDDDTSEPAAPAPAPAVETDVEMAT
ncbi:hypothetical protein DFH11DRAFT_1597364 [Phellopilus nigrolimitatus]|nr:hypothetical protein DFH11DRAFT_1597364 [Phellopilus nigrolimitatus]